MNVTQVYAKVCVKVVWKGVCKGVYEGACNVENNSTPLLWGAELLYIDNKWKKNCNREWTHEREVKGIDYQRTYSLALVRLDI